MATGIVYVGLCILAILGLAALCAIALWAWTSTAEWYQSSSNTRRIVRNSRIARQAILRMQTADSLDEVRRLAREALADIEWDDRWRA